MNKTQLLDISFGFVKAADGWLDSLSQYLSANPAARNALIGTAAGAGVGGLGSVLTGSKNTLRNTLLGGLLGGAGGGIGTAMLRASDGAQPTRAGGAPPDLLRAMNPALLPGNAVRHALQAPAGKGEAVPDLLRAVHPALLPGNAVRHALQVPVGKEAAGQADQKLNSFTDDLADKMFKTTNRLTGVPE
jgi:hypothetical protein